MSLLLCSLLAQLSVPVTVLSPTDRFCTVPPRRRTPFSRLSSPVLYFLDTAVSNRRSLWLWAALDRKGCFAFLSFPHKQDVFSSIFRLLFFRFQPIQKATIVLNRVLARLAPPRQLPLWSPDSPLFLCSILAFLLGRNSGSAAALPLRFLECLSEARAGTAPPLPGLAFSLSPGVTIWAGLGMHSVLAGTLLGASVKGWVTAGAQLRSGLGSVSMCASVHVSLCWGSVAACPAGCAGTASVTIATSSSSAGAPGWRPAASASLSSLAVK
ncbi:UNVERIFIED_CONTAM: hypothetical protein FKN15_029823 [Acipenser sinensis]